MYPKQLCRVEKQADDSYDAYLKKHLNKGLSINQIFLNVIRNQDMIILRKMLSDIRVDPGYRENEALIYCVLNKNYIIAELLVADKRVDPSDQNNMALRLAVNGKDKRMIEILLKHPEVLQSIYGEKDLLSCIWLYQNNGNVLI
jgi:hypothetical protein